ncbi:MAG: hypothetical protein LQ341_002040, partial [Variospora aurantia]
LPTHKPFPKDWCFEGFNWKPLDPEPKYCWELGTPNYDKGLIEACYEKTTPCVQKKSTGVHPAPAGCLDPCADDDGGILLVDGYPYLKDVKKRELDLGIPILPLIDTTNGVRLFFRLYLSLPHFPFTSPSLAPSLPLSPLPLHAQQHQIQQKLTPPPLPFSSSIINITPPEMQPRQRQKLLLPQPQNLHRRTRQGLRGRPETIPRPSGLEPGDHGFVL